MEYYGNNDFRDYHLAHFGIKGMHWGVRRYQPYGEGGYVPRKTKKRARKDAKEYARAQMFYGEGAGNRRKLIKATVKQRSKDPVYKAEFEKYLAEQDFSKHASAAKRERRTKDTVAGGRKVARGLINISAGNVAGASAAALATYGAYKIMKNTGTDKKIRSAMNDSYTRAKRNYASRTKQQTVDDFLRERGY